MERLVSEVKDTVPTPELVSFRTILGVRVGCDVSTDTAAKDSHASHLVMNQLFLVPGNIHVSWLDYLVTGFTVIDDGEDVLVSFLYPVSLG